MAESSWPSPNHNSRAVSDSEYEKLSALFSGDGVYGDPTDTAAVSAGTGLQVVVRANLEASVRGHYWTSGTTGQNLTVTANSSGQTRYDWIVLRLDRSTWDVNAALHAGTPGAGKPSVTRSTGSTGVFEVTLGYLQIDSGASTVTVVPYTQYVGSRVRPCTSTTHTAIGLGGIEYEQDTGQWTGWNGNSRVVLYQDTGNLSLTGTFADWSAVKTNAGRRVGDVVTLRVWKSRLRSTLSGSDPNGSQLAVVPPQLIPASVHNFGVNVSGGAGTATLQVRNDGSVWVINNSEDIPVGAEIAVTCTYLATL